MDGLIFYCQPDLAKVVEDWNQALKIRQLSNHTHRAYNTDLTHFLKFMNGHIGQPVSINDLSDAAIRDFRSWLTSKAMDGTKSSSRARSLAGIRNFFNWMDNTKMYIKKIGIINWRIKIT